MKFLFYISILLITVYSCDSTKSVIKGDKNPNSTINDTLRIANDSLEYEIIIIEPGFNNWLVTQPPKNYYGLTYLETKNRIWVTEYNSRVLGVGANRNLYEQQINYDPFTHYGLEVNYLLYNYFVYFQKTYNQNFIGGRR